VPYASAGRVFWVVDNGSSYRGQASIRRLEGKYTNLRLIHLPVHTSWLNQIEIYFSIVQRKVLTPNDFKDLAEVAQRLLGLPAPLPAGRKVVRLAVHPRRPGPTPTPPGPTSSAHQRRMTTAQAVPSRPDGSRRRSRRSDLEEAVERRRCVLVARGTMSGAGAWPGSSLSWPCRGRLAP